MNPMWSAIFLYHENEMIDIVTNDLSIKEKYWHNDSYDKLDFPALILDLMSDSYVYSGESFQIEQSKDGSVLYNIRHLVFYRYANA